MDGGDEAEALKGLLDAPALREFAKPYRVEVLDVGAFGNQLTDEAD